MKDDECALCGKTLAAFGIILGVAFLYMATDVFSNGKLTGLFRREVIEDE